MIKVTVNTERFLRPIEKHYVECTECGYVSIHDDYQEAHDARSAHEEKHQ